MLINMPQHYSPIMLFRASDWRIILITFVVLFALPKVHTSCDSTKGCFPPIFEIFEDYAHYPARSVYASSVCGSNSTTPVEYRSLIVSDVKNYTCQPSTIQPINVVDSDRNLQTYWQSDKMIKYDGAAMTPQYLAFNFSDEFLFHGIIITFMALPKPSLTNSADARPAAFSVEKLDSSYQNWLTLEHFAKDCGKSFPGVPIYDPFSTNPDFSQVYCSILPSPSAGETIDDYINEVEYSPGMRYDNYDYLYQNNIKAASRFTASGIRIFIREPVSTDPMKSYVTITDVTIDTQCKCNGHADTCDGQNNATCKCQHNTFGQQCNSCLPLFNNRSWTIGNTTNPGLCLECACKNRANSCILDQVKGYGVCVNCTDNSAGDACDSCIGGFYINPIYSNATSPSSSIGTINGGSASTVGGNFCLACNCSGNGTQTSSLSTCDVTTGQCNCKERVTLRDCSSCKDTFWGLNASNSLGCNVCSCNPQGSLGSTNMCNKTTGQCICKANVESLCDRCKPYMYKFDPLNPDGCTPCDCDPGASTSKTCDLFSGQCSCYSNIGGRDCRSPLIGNYVPRLDIMILEPEQYTTQDTILRSGHGTKGATVSGRGFFRLTSANKMIISFISTVTAFVNVVLRIEKTTADNFIFLQGTLTLNSAVIYNCSDGQTVSTGQIWTLQFSNIMNSNRGGVIMGRVCLNRGTSYIIQITGPTSTLLVDSIVFLLDVSSVILKSSDSLNVTFATSCAQSAVNTLRSGRDSCADTEYSLVAALFQRALPCSCVGGALNTTTSCDSHSGDCSCLSGALPPDCTQCFVDHYKFSTQTGCTACGCHVNGSRTDSCDDQGVCQCLPNVLGTKCDSCISQHFGLYTGSGCTPCQCNMMYSINNNCNDYGQCACQPGVGGLPCNACMSRYYNLTSTGCTQCGCDQNGSTQQSCDISTGNCQCLPRVEGSTCSNCKLGTFGLGKWNAEGCIYCFCWSHGKNCSSVIGWFDSPITSMWSVSNQYPPIDVWSAEDANGTKINVLTPIVTTSNGSQYVLRINESQRGSSDIFFIAPSKFLGDRKSAYGRFLKITLLPSPITLPVNNVSTARSDKMVVNVTLTGNFRNVTLTYTYHGNLTLSSEILISSWFAKNAVPGSLYQQVFTIVEITMVLTLFAGLVCHKILFTVDPCGQIPIIESEWQAVGFTNDGNLSYFAPTYSNMMEVIGGLSSLKILAYQGNLMSSAVDLLSVKLDGAVDGSRSLVHTGITVNNVEQCACDPGYMGNSCEQCAPHYTRAVTNSTDPLSQCVPCLCNGHGLIQCNQSTSNCTANPVRACDPLTGVCYCQHNTKGDHCEICLSGYYGDPKKGTKDDCLPCACPGIVVANETNVFATSCVQNITNEPICVDCQKGHTGNHCELCVDGYFGTPENVTNFGGACRLCECNGHAITCNNRTGECVACSNNTAGRNCEICAPGYYGSAVNSTCQPCACNFTGSTGLCDHVTGICECLSNVSGLLCDVCNDGTFNLTAKVGCQPCNCYMNGSTSSICNKVTGQCACTKLVTGQFCDKCQSSYWNVNLVTGCDACQCNPAGTLLENGTAITACDVKTGQCTCALPGIVGRTCDQCSPVSKYTFEYVSLFYIGSYPKCELCGECFDSWAQKIEEIGQEMAQLNKSVFAVWSTYDFQTAKQIDANLTVLENKVTNMSQSIMNFEGLSSQLIDLQTKFYEAQAQQDKIASEINMMIQTQQTLSTTLRALASLNDNVQVTATAIVSFSTLLMQYNGLFKEAMANISQGNSSWVHIQSLIFVVSAPEDKNKQILAQVTSLMEKANDFNQTLQQIIKLYETSLMPGVSKNAQELTIISQITANASSDLANVKAIITRIQSDVNSFNTSLTSLATLVTATKENLLKVMMSLQEYVTNASKSQVAAEKLLADVKKFKTVAEKAEQTIINSTTRLLQYLVILNQAQSNLSAALSLSTTAAAVEIPTQATLQQLVNQIQNSTLTEEEVSKMKMQSQQTKFASDQAAMKAQRALSLSKTLQEEITLMNSDVTTSRDMRAQAQALRLTCDTLNTSINTVLQQVKNHSDIVTGNITAVTQSAQILQAEVRNATLCLVQKQSDITNAEIAASQVKQRADSASSNQLKLLEIMQTINFNNMADISQTLSKVTQANSLIKEVLGDIEQLQLLAQFETLIQELQAQNLQIANLNQEITQLTSQLDSIILLLQESSGGTNCVAK